MIVPGHLPIQEELGQAEADGGHGDEDAVKDPQHGQDVPEGHLKEGNLYWLMKGLLTLDNVAQLIKDHTCRYAPSIFPTP